MTVVVLGSANMDLVVRQPRLPEPGETMFGSGFQTVAGGKGLNQAVAAARAGAPVAFAGAVGADANGAELRAVLEGEGIATAALAELDAPTGIAAISVLDDGENSIVVVSGANAEVAALDDAAREAIRGASHLVMQFELPQSALLEGARLARELGAVTVLTPAPALDPVDGLLELVDILVPNGGEARALSGADDDAEAARILSGRVGTVVVTRGGEGALVARGGEIVHEVAPVRVEPVDTTGAGDTFVGVLVAGLADGLELEPALARAAAGAAVSVTRAGATSSMPSRDEIDAALAG
ncbi:ribokinase [Homoserinibacter sp. YIM 151385]|uniref:ribokinase n=1 Tax=Homoserinibacter sp. YIM 151385 TaxID=2985506 RepID=UPI0022F08284|nr:ribokinase [Homoserinibacter sp. YIM 151385]WBU36952.1 ribokinase [Homoserinibacter sp. YIM 151385]